MSQPAPPPVRSSEQRFPAVAWLLPIAAFVITVGAVLLRQEGVPKLLTIWAEDGRDFAGCAYLRPLVPDCLLEPYAGWLHGVPRIGAAIATLVPPADLSIALGAIAAIVTGLAAAVVAVAIHEATRSWPAGLLGSASLGLVWQAAFEVGGNLTNIHWVLMAASIVVIVAWWIGARSTPPTLTLLAATTVTSPFGLFLVALILVGAALRRPAWRTVLVVTAIGSLIQLVGIATTPREAPGREPFIFSLVVARYVRDVLAAGAFGPLRLPINWLVPLGIIATAAVAALVLLRPFNGDEALAGQPRPRWLVLPIVGTLVGSGFLLFVAISVLQHKDNQRYSYIPAVLMCVALVVGAAMLRDAWAASSKGAAAAILKQIARLALPVAALVLMAGWSRTFRIETKASDGPDYIQAYRAAAMSCGGNPGGRIRVPISPVGAASWAVEIPCDRVQASER